MDVFNSSFIICALGAVLVSYLIGSIPFAVLAGHLFHKKDIRTRGSRNAGATNIFRVFGARWAILVALADFLKGFFPVFFAPRLVLFLMGVFDPQKVSFPGETAPRLLMILSLSGVVAGHAFPLWARFKGGKGVAASAGGITALFPLSAPFCLALFILVLKATSYASLASLAAAWFLPLFYFLAGFTPRVDFSLPVFIFFLLLALGVTLLHRANLGRLFRGEENKLLWRNSKEDDRDGN